MKRHFSCILLIAAGTMLAACDPTPSNPPASDTDGHALVLNEGSWGGNNASLSLLNSDNGDIANDWFSQSNGRGMGDVAQDIVVYGSHAYATVTFSNSLEAIDLATGKSNRIDFGEGQSERFFRPRSIAAANGQLFISCYGSRSVVSVDTLSLLAYPATTGAIRTCPLGDYLPEGLAVAGNRLFVASSWISDENQNYTYDNKVYVIDIDAFTIVDTLTVGLNPQQVVAIDASHVAVNYNGNYGNQPAGCAIIDANTLSVSQTGLGLTGITAANGMLYGYCRQGYGAGSSATYWRLSPSSSERSQVAISIGNPYSINVNPVNGDILVTTDGNYTANGDVMCFSADGTHKWTAEAELLPKKVVFFGK